MQVTPTPVIQPQKPNTSTVAAIEKSVSSTLPEPSPKPVTPASSNSDSSVSQVGDCIIKITSQSNKNSSVAPQKKKFDWSDTSKYQNLFSDLASPTPVAPTPSLQPTSR